MTLAREDSFSCGSNAASCHTTLAVAVVFGRNIVFRNFVRGDLGIGVLCVLDARQNFSLERLPFIR
jgi:hypothetical protein